MNQMVAQRRNKTTAPLHTAHWCSIIALIAAIFTGCGGPSENLAGSKPETNRATHPADNTPTSPPSDSAATADPAANTPTSHPSTGANAPTGPAPQPPTHTDPAATSNPPTQPRTVPPDTTGPSTTPPHSHSDSTTTPTTPNETTTPRPETRPETQPDPTVGAGNAELGLPDTAERDEAERVELRERFRHLPRPADAAARQAVATELLRAIDDLQGTSEWEAVGKYLAEQADSRADDPLVTVMRGFYFDCDGGDRAETAWPMIQSVADAAPDFAWPWFLLATHANRTGDSARALELVDKAIALERAFFDARRFKTALLAALGRTAEAKNFVEETLTLKPDDIAAELDLLAGIGEDARVRELLRGGTLPAVTQARGHLLLAYSMAAKRRPTAADVAEARAGFRRAMGVAATMGATLRERRNLRRTWIEAHLILAKHLVEVEPKDMAEAFELLERLLTHDPQNPDGLVMFAQLARLTADAVRAQKALDLLLDYADTPRKASGVMLFATGMAQVIDAKSNTGPISRAPIWQLMGLAVGQYKASETPDELRQAAYQILEHFLCATQKDADLEIPLPCDPKRFADVPHEHIEAVLDWLQAQTHSDEFRVRLPAMDFLPLIVRATGVRKDRLVGLALDVLRQPVGGTADAVKAQWARVLAILGDKTHAGAILEALEAIMAAGDEVAARRVIKGFHLALRTLVDTDFRRTWRPARATMIEMQRLTEAWRTRLGPTTDGG